MWRAEQAAIQPVGPTVVRALNSSGETSFWRRTQARPPVTADVIESFYRGCITANHNNAFARYLAQEIVAGVGNVAGASGADPTFKKETLDLAAE